MSEPGERGDGGEGGLIRIVVVDDHPIVRQGLVGALDDETDFRVVGAAGSSRRAAERRPARPRSPDPSRSYPRHPAP